MVPTKDRSTGSDHLLTYKRYYNLVCVMMRSSFGRPPAPLCVTISCVALSTLTSTAASDRLYFVLDGTKDRSFGSDHLLTYKRYCNLVCVMMRSSLGGPPAPLCATISCVALSTLTSTAASDRLYFVWDRTKDKSTGSDYLLTYKRYTTSYVSTEDLFWVGHQYVPWPPPPLCATIW
jgi:hypothetical protein